VQLDIVVTKATLVQLSLEVVDIALGSGQLILSLLQSGVGVVKVVDLEVTAAIRPNSSFSSLMRISRRALLNVLDDTVLSLHLVGALLQPETQVSAHRCDLLKQGAHVLGIACREHPTCMMGRKLGVANGGYALTPHRIALILNEEQGDSGVAEDR
jgi:hypothetical protein